MNPEPGSVRHALQSQLFHAGWRPCHAEGEGGVDESLRREGGEGAAAIAVLARGGREISLLSNQILIENITHHTHKVLLIPPNHQLHPVDTSSLDTIKNDLQIITHRFPRSPT